MSSKKWLLNCSIEGIDIDYSTIIESDIEPGFWACYEIAETHNCEFFSIEEITVD